MEQGVVLGVDVGYSSQPREKQGRSVGLAVLEWSADAVTFEVDHVKPADFKERVLEMVGARSVDCAAFDGPLRPDLGLVKAYRQSEMLVGCLQQLIGKAAQCSSPTGWALHGAATEMATFVAQTLEVALARHEAKIHPLALVEAFPTSFLGVLLAEDEVPPHGARSDAYYAALTLPPAKPVQENRLELLLRRLLPDRKIEKELGEISNHDDRAGLVCAMTALCVARRQYVAAGISEDGYIILPPRAEHGQVGMQPWAWEQLQKKAEVEGAPLIVE